VARTLFTLGACRMTPGARDALAAAALTPADLLVRHARGDWGDVDADDRAANDASVRDGSRILSAYRLAGGGRVWVLTEARGDDGRRDATTLLLPDEYGPTPEDRR
jgi:hypothetical protein